MGVLSGCQRMDLALKLLDEMTSHGLVPDTQSYRLLITQCELIGVLRREVALFHTLEDLSRDAWSSDRVLGAAAFNVAAIRLLAAGHAGEAAELLTGAATKGRSNAASLRVRAAAGAAVETAAEGRWAE